MKLDFSRRTRLSENCATFTSSLASEESLTLRLSIDIATTLSLDLMEMVTTVESGTTKGRTFKLWGATGAMMITFDSGTHIGPPTLKEYAVDPELVETRSPSAQ